MEDGELYSGIIDLSEPFKAQLIRLADGFAEMSQLDQENIAMMGVIGGLRLWLFTAPLHHPERLARQIELNVRQRLFNRRLITAEIIRRDVNRMLGDLFHDFIGSGLMAATPPAIYCETIEDVEAVQILLQHIADWFWNYIPLIAVDHVTNPTADMVAVYAAGHHFNVLQLF